MRTGVDFDVSDGQRGRLEEIANSGHSRTKHARRARIILLTDDGMGTMAVADVAGASKPTVWRWQERFMQEGVEGLLRDKTRKSGTPRVPEEKVRKLLELAPRRPPNGETHWTVRALAKEVGVSPATAHRILVRHRLAPHKVRQFKVSTDPKFAEKTHDVIALYMDPPDRAVVLSIDEKTQIQALGRTRKALPMKPGRPATMTHEDKRNGTTTLFAATDILDGTAVGSHSERHRHQEFIAFLEQVDKAAPAGRKIHAIVDNYSAHKHKAVLEWLADHPRWTLQFTPTSCSWTDAVEGFFGKLARRRLRRGVYDSLEDLKAAIEEFIALHNGKEAKPFRWTASPERLIAVRQRGYQMTEIDH